MCIIVLWYSQGAPEGILDRCSFVRVNGQEKIAMTPEIKAQILQVVKKYGTGKSICGILQHVGRVAERSKALV